MRYGLMTRLLVCVLLGVCSGYSVANDTPPTPEWQGVIDAGYISSMGTTTGSKDTSKGKFAVTHNGSYWTNILSAEGLATHDDATKTTDLERYLVNYKARHFITTADFFTLRLQWEKDLTSTSEYQAFGSLGLGRDLIKTDSHYLKIECGPGMRHNELRLVPPRDEAIGLLSWDYLFTLNTNSHFIQKASIESGRLETVTRINSQFKQNITKVLALTINDDYKYVRGDVRQRQGALSFGLNYQF